MAVTELKSARGARGAMRDVAVACVVVLTAQTAFHASAQTSRLTMQGPAENADSATIRDSLGRPCLDVEAGARRQIVNPNASDHIVSIKNNCSKPLKLKVCYFNSESCKMTALSSYGRSDVILGTALRSTFFRYTIIQMK